MTDPKVKDRTTDKGKDGPQPKEPLPSKGSGPKHDVQPSPEDQRGRPDPKERSSI